MRWLPSFPLLVKELTEQSARKRTYFLRSAYAALLLIAFAVMYNSTLNMTSSGHLGMIGMGSQLFEVVFYCQYWAILLLMPALASGSLTTEKEQGSLTILLLTDLGPWELILQKWLSRIMIVGSYLLLSLPLMGLCYALGGLEVRQLVIGMYVLILVCLQTAAVAIAVSAWCRSSITALLGSYAVLAAIFLGIWLISGNFSRRSFGLSQILTYLWPENIYSSRLQFSMNEFFILTLPSYLLIGFSLLFARWALIRRAQLSGPAPLLRLFRYLDALFERGDARIGRRHTRIDVPENDPVAWRELNRRSLANWRYLTRFLVVGFGSLTMLIMVLAIMGNNLIQILQFSSLCLLGLSLLLALILGSTIIAAERTQQTLDVLLTTPLTARVILVEKLRGLRRILGAILIPALALMIWSVYEDDLMGYSRSRGEYHQPKLIGVFAYFIILPPLFTWFAVTLGLFIRSRYRAMLVALIGGCLWLGSTMLFAIILFGLMEMDDKSPFTIVYYFTPSMLPILNEFGPSDANHFFGGATLATIVFVIWHGGLWYGLRYWCLKHADRLMRRSVGS